LSKANFPKLNTINLVENCMGGKGADCLKEKFANLNLYH